MTAIQPNAYTPEGPQPLLREVAQGACYPIEALGPLREAAEAAQATTQAPMALAAQSALSVASLAVQAHGDVETLGGFAPVSLYCLTIARSGERKSATDKLLMAGLREFEREASTAYQQDVTAWENAAEIYKSDRAQVMAGFKKAKGTERAATQADLEALGGEPSAPLLPNLTATEPTLEGLHKLFMAGQPALGLFSDEGGGFLGGHGMSQDHRLKTVAGLSALWGGDPLTRVRAGDGTSSLFGRRLAAHLMVQPVAARPLLADPVASGQGFLARFLIAEPQSAIGLRLAPEAPTGAATQLAAFSARLRAILDAQKPLAGDTLQQLEPPHLALSQDARTVLWEYYVETETAQQMGGGLEGLTAYASKTAEQAARIAGVLTLWESLSAREIQVGMMKKGVKLARFYLGEAKRLAEAAEISAETEKAERLRLWLLQSWPGIAVDHGRDPQTILPRDIIRFGPGSMREGKAVTALTGMLVKFGWLAPLEHGAVIDGAARRVAFQIIGRGIGQ
ncbi:YfjI family protein [Gymnodinialimonas sp.]